jgi:hypothetical protein
VQQRHLLAGLAIIAIWVAVLFVGVFGGDIATEDTTGGSTEIPIVSAVAFFAAIATSFVAWFGFRT